MFNKNTIIIILNKAWKELQYIYILFLFVPYLLLLASFSFFSNVITVELDEQSFFESKESQDLAGLITSFLITINCLFIMGQELYQLVKNPKTYFLNVWNYIDSLPIVSAMFPVIFYLKGHTEDLHESWKDTVMISQVCAAIVLWTKFLYFLRSWKRTGALIRLLTEVIKDMLTFLFILLIAVLAFGDAFYSLSNSRPKEERFTTGYVHALITTYLIGLGEFELSDYGENNLARVLFTLCTIFNCVVMLNLLIAIISDTYAQVMATENEQAMRERANIITDVLSFNFFKRFLKKRNPETFMLIAMYEPQQDFSDEINLSQINTSV